LKTIRFRKLASCGLAAAIAVTGLITVSASPASAATDVKIAVGPYNEMGAVQYAVDAKIFAKNGINVTEFVTFPAPPPGLAALASGAVQFAYAPIIPVINAYVNGGMALKIVSANHGISVADLNRAKKNPAYAAAIDNTGVCVNPSSNFTSFKNLEGKTVAVPARKAQGEVVVANMIKKAGGNPATVNWVTLGFPETVGAVKSGKVDAAYVVEPFVSNCTAAGMKSLGAPGVGFYTTEPVIGVWVTTAPYAAANPTVISAFQKSIKQATTFGMASLSNKLVLLEESAKLTKQPVDVARKSRPTYYPPIVTKNDVTSQAKKMFDLGYLTKQADVAGLLLPQLR
jgi:NitT/TauT family transport system substrate-binding protein